MDVLSMNEPQWWSDSRQVAICMAFDAFRICLGGQPRNFTRAQVAQWFAIMLRAHSGREEPK
jgi:hypothetical protein